MHSKGIITILTQALYIVNMQNRVTEKYWYSILTEARIFYLKKKTNNYPGNAPTSGNNSSNVLNWYYTYDEIHFIDVPVNIF